LQHKNFKNLTDKEQIGLTRSQRRRRPRKSTEGLLPSSHGSPASGLIREWEEDSLDNTMVIRGNNKKKVLH